MIFFHRNINKLIFIAAIFSVAAFINSQVLAWQLVNQPLNFATVTPKNEISEQLPHQAADSSQVTLIAVGDIMLSRVVAQKIKINGSDYPFAKVHDYLNSADLAFANLESPLTPGRE